MGTNYYLIEDICPHCKKGDSIHIGKSSVGWRFCLRVQEDTLWSNFTEFKEILKQQEGIRIEDEYGEVHTPEHLLELIESKVDGSRQPSAENNRVELDGPVDLCFYEFS